MHESDVLIIGAGISGLLCAKELQQAGLRARVVDKGRGVGGRMATRRMGGGRIDHGAQFFTVRNAQFYKHVQEWLDAGIVREWYRTQSAPDQTESSIHYCGTSGMSDAPKHLACQLDVHCAERILQLNRENTNWIATSESQNVFCAQELVITAPLPQTIQMLDTAHLDWAGDNISAFRNARYAKGLALLAILDGPSGLADPGAIKLGDDHVLEWIADNQMKGICPEGTVGITAHTTAAFAEKHWDADNDVRVPLITEALQHHVHARITDWQCHRWGFTHPLTTWHEPYYRNPEIKLTLAGDAFGGPRVEAAALSGLAAAAQIQA